MVGYTPLAVFIERKHYAEIFASNLHSAAGLSHNGKHEHNGENYRGGEYYYIARRKRRFARTYNLCSVYVQ
jgi:hypothetical protein